MKLKALALLAFAAIGLGAGTSFDSQAYGRRECLLDCRFMYEDCLADGGGSLCVPAYRACTAECMRYH